MTTRRRFSREIEQEVSGLLSPLVAKAVGAFGDDDRWRGRRRFLRPRGGLRRGWWRSGQVEATNSPSDASDSTGERR